MYKGYLQELKISEVSNNLRQLALKIQSYELQMQKNFNKLQYLL
jgi:hypothetical protein